MIEIHNMDFLFLVQQVKSLEVICHLQSVQSFSCVRLFVTPWTAALQASLSITNSQSLLKLMSIKSAKPSNHLTLCHPLLLPSVFPSIRVFSNELSLCVRWPKYWSFSFSISLPSEYSGLISFRIDIMCACLYIWASLIAQSVKNLPAMQETRVRSLGQEDPWRRA